MSSEINSNHFTHSGMDKGKTTVFVNHPCILCVDDDPVGLELRGHILRAEGYAVVLLSRPELAFSHDLSTYQLAIFDFNMPGLNGCQLLRQLRALGARFPVLLLSGTLEAVPQNEAHLFMRCLDKASPITRLLSAVAAGVGLTAAEKMAMA